MVEFEPFDCEEVENGDCGLFNRRGNRACHLAQIHAGLLETAQKLGINSEADSGGGEIGELLKYINENAVPDCAANMEDAAAHELDDMIAEDLADYD